MDVSHVFTLRNYKSFSEYKKKRAHFLGMHVQFAYCIRPMHEVVPKVVAMAVRIVASKWMIFWMISFLDIFLSFE